MTLKSLLLALATAFALSGCATTQRTFDSAALGQIKTKKSTRDDVRRLLGEPDSVNTASEREIWTYSKKGRTTGNALTDAFRSSALIGPFGTIHEDLNNSDIVIVYFKKGVVSDVERNTTAKPGAGPF